MSSSSSLQMARVWLQYTNVELKALGLQYLDNVDNNSHNKSRFPLGVFWSQVEKYSAFSSIWLVNWFLQVLTRADSKESWTLFNFFFFPRVFFFVFSSASKNTPNGNRPYRAVCKITQRYLGVLQHIFKTYQKQLKIKYVCFKGILP